MLWPSVCVPNISIWFLQLFGSSECDVVLPAGEFGIWGSIWHILMFPTSSAGVIMCVHMFRMPGWWLDPSVSSGCLVSGFGGFDSIGHILMVSASSAGVSILFPVFCMSIVSQSEGLGQTNNHNQHNKGLWKGKWWCASTVPERIRLWEGGCFYTKGMMQMQTEGTPND